MASSNVSYKALNVQPLRRRDNREAIEENLSANSASDSFRNNECLIENSQILLSNNLRWHIIELNCHIYCISNNINNTTQSLKVKKQKQQANKIIITVHLGYKSSLLSMSKGTTLKGEVPARFRAVLLPIKLFLMAKTMSKVRAVPHKKKEHKNLTRYA